MHRTPEFVEEPSDALGGVKNNESTILLENFNTHVESTAWHFATKCAAVKSVKPGM